MNIEEELSRRSQRGTPRGADAIFDAATTQAQSEQPAKPSSGRYQRSGSRLFVAAACITAVIGISTLLLSSRLSQDEEISTAPETSLAEADVTTTQTTKPVDDEAPDLQPLPVPTSTVDDEADPSGSFVEADYSIEGRSVDEFSVQPGDGDRWSAQVIRAGHGSVFVRPDQAFTAVNETIVVEADVAVGREEYGQESWVELIVTTGSRPDNSSQVFGQDYFETQTSIGCRIEATHDVNCRQEVPGNPDASWSASWFEPVGQDSFGGNDVVDNREYFRHCAEGANAEDCLDRFRLEITRDRLTLYVNGLRYFEQSNFEESKLISNDVLEGEFFVYAVSTYTPRSSDEVRFDWGALTVNPATGPTPSPYFP